jgi:four helix bundle protein
MATIERFEDVEAWKKARELTKLVYQVTRSGEFSRDFALRDQIRRSSVSTMSNIAEGFERGGNREFRQFLVVAKGSAGEVRSQLYVALDAGFVMQKQFDDLYGITMDSSRLISGFIKYLDQSDYRGKRLK